MLGEPILQAIICESPSQVPRVVAANKPANVRHHVGDTERCFTEVVPYWMTPRTQHAPTYQQLWSLQEFGVSEAKHDGDAPVGEESAGATEAEEAVAHEHGAVVAHIPVLRDVLVVHHQRHLVWQGLHSALRLSEILNSALHSAGAACEVEWQGHMGNGLDICTTKLLLSEDMNHSAAP